MAEITLVRHAQASFGAEDYDRLSALGQAQARALGQALARQGLAPVALFVGAQRRHRETLEGLAVGLGFDTDAARVLPGLNEFDAEGLLTARFRAGPRPEGLGRDRRAHFRVLRETVLMWQRDEISDPPESFAAFAARVGAAQTVLAEAAQRGAGPVLAVSSGGAISWMVARALDAPPEAMIALQLQMKNCAVSRLIAAPRGAYLHGFNETPHIAAENAAEMLTYS